LPIIGNVGCGRVPPYLPLVNGANERHVIRDQVAEAADVFARSVAAPVSKSVSKEPPAGGAEGR